MMTDFNNLKDANAELLEALKDLATACYDNAFKMEAGILSDELLIAGLVIARAEGLQ